MSPTLGPIRRESGIAGQIAYSVPVSYPGESTRIVSFVGSTYGTPGPVVMVTGPGHADQIVVDSPARHGSTLSPAWVRSFYGVQA